MMTAAPQPDGKMEITLGDYKHVRILEREGERWIDTEFYEEEDVPRIGECEAPLGEVYRKVGLER